MHDIVRQVIASVPVGQGVVACACLSSECADGPNRWKISPSFLSCTSPNRCSHWRSHPYHNTWTDWRTNKASTDDSLLPCGSPYHSSHCSCCCHWGGKLFMVLWVACGYHFGLTHHARAQSTSFYSNQRSLSPQHIVQCWCQQEWAKYTSYKWWDIGPKAAVCDIHEGSGDS